MVNFVKLGIYVLSFKFYSVLYGEGENIDLVIFFISNDRMFVCNGFVIM